MDSIESLYQHATALKDNVQKNTDVSVEMCYQCGKCTAGCPLNDEMDIAPNQILRMLQLGFPELEEKLLSSLSIWLCLTCETCYSRCPKEVELPLVMDYLRQESIRRGLVNSKAKDILEFHRSFLETVESLGKMHEVTLFRKYKLKTMHLLQDLSLVPGMISSGKLGIIPHKIKNQEAIARIFRNTIIEKEG
jgi:heterodisulfide reductase subunit C2